MGCGSSKMNPDSIGIDILDYPEVDIVGDIFGGIDSDTGDEVEAGFNSGETDLSGIGYENN